VNPHDNPPANSSATYVVGVPLYCGKHSPIEVGAGGGAGAARPHVGILQQPFGNMSLHVSAESPFSVSQ
jgi:hypothetical protein